MDSYCWKYKRALLFLFVSLTTLVVVSYDREQYIWRDYHHRRRDPAYIALESQVNDTGCKLPRNGFTAWEVGVVTAVRPSVVKNCTKLLAGDRKERERVKKASAGWKSDVSYPQLLNMTADCLQLMDTFRHNVYISELEDSFPIAFSFVVYDSPEQFLRLLRLLYRPGNVYCIHVDTKTKFYKFFANIARCFSNIILAQRRFDVMWGHKSLLSAQMSCLSDLARYRQKHTHQRWRYVVNLCGKELPLISVKEMVTKLLHMNTTSSVFGWPIPAEETWTIQRLRGKILPHNLTLYKSMTYNALSEPFVNFLLQNTTAQEVYRFFLETDFPEEHFYATLFQMPGVPGGYDPRIPEEGYFEVGHYFWRTNREEVRLPCYGKTVHGICVVSFGDLPRIMNETGSGSTALFQNKYFMELDHVAMDCMEERIVAGNRREFEQDCKANEMVKHV